MISIDLWRQQGRLANLGGRRVFVVDTGETDRPAILLIHGFPTSSWDWTPVWQTLHRDYRLVAMDLLGFGFSDKPNPHDYRIHEQADLCDAVVRECGLDEFHVLAHDYGDTVAQELLARQNEGTGAGRWLSLCLLNGGLFPETHQARLIQKLLLSPVGPLVARLGSRRAFDRSLSAVFGAATQPSRAELDAFWQLVRHNDGHRIFHRLIAYMTDRKRHRARWVGALIDAAIPVGLINGSVDPVSGKHMVARYRELVPRDDFIVELPTIGHYPQVEAPDDVLRAYAAFLAR